jgi:hypothetical protein
MRACQDVSVVMAAAAAFSKSSPSGSGMMFSAAVFTYSA